MSQSPRVKSGTSTGMLPWIDVHVEGQAVAQAVNQAVVHHEVHAAVAADLLGYLADFLVNRVHVFIHESLAGCLRYEAVGAEVLVVGHLVRADVLRLESEALDGVLIGEALGTGQLVLAVVGAGSHDVVVNLDHLAVGGAEEGDGVVTVGALIEAHLVLHELEAVDGLGVESDQGL